MLRMKPFAIKIPDKLKEIISRWLVKHEKERGQKISMAQFFREAAAEKLSKDHNIDST